MYHEIDRIPVGWLYIIGSECYGPPLDPAPRRSNPVRTFDPATFPTVDSVLEHVTELAGDRLANAYALADDEGALQDFTIHRQTRRGGIIVAIGAFSGHGQAYIMLEDAPDDGPAMVTWTREGGRGEPLPVG